jgi:L-asparaginase
VAAEEGHGRDAARGRLAAAAAFDPCFEPVAALVRGGSVESVHRGAVAVMGADGDLLGSVGDPGCRVLLRSSAKPFQAAALVASGAADAFSLTGEELAVIAASHAGTAAHVDIVRRLLERAGLSANALVCGPLEHMCSGKHAGMMLLARHLGVSEAGYEREDHPAQREIRDFAAAQLDERLPADGVRPRPAAALFAGTDNCGVPVLGMTLLQAAWLFARLAAGATPALARVRDAMTAHPVLVAGEGRLDTSLMRAGGGGIVSKAGAEGVQGFGLLDGAVGCVVKMEDGSSRAVPVVTAAILRAWEHDAEAGAVEQAHPAGITGPDGAQVAWIEPLVEAASVRRPRHGSSTAEAGASTGATGWGAAGAPAPAARFFRRGKGDSLVVSRIDDKEVVHFLQEQWPSVDMQYFGHPVEWRAEPYALVYKRDRRVVGVLKGHFIGGLASVDELMVGDGARGCGLGSRLLGRFEDEARRRRCAHVVLRAVKDSPAEAFYRKRGYHRECVQRGYEFGYDYVRLVCEVERALGESQGPAWGAKGGS